MVHFSWTDSPPKATYPARSLRDIEARTLTSVVCFSFFPASPLPRPALDMSLANAYWVLVRLSGSDTRSQGKRLQLDSSVGVQLQQ